MIQEDSDVYCGSIVVSTCRCLMIVSIHSAVFVMLFLNACWGGHNMVKAYSLLRVTFNCVWLRRELLSMGMVFRCFG